MDASAGGQICPAFQTLLKRHKCSFGYDLCYSCGEKTKQKTKQNQNKKHMPRHSGFTHPLHPPHPPPQSSSKLNTFEVKAGPCDLIAMVNFRSGGGVGGIQPRYKCFRIRGCSAVEEAHLQCKCHYHHYRQPSMQTRHQQQR